MEENSVIPGYVDVNAYSQASLQTVLSAIKSSNELPSAGDTYDYYSSFKGFQQFMNKEAKMITDLMSALMKKAGRRPLKGLDLEEKYDAIVDFNDSILEKVGNLLDEASGKKKQEELIIATVRKDREISTSWNRKINSLGTKYQLLTAKNILRPQIKFADKIDNSNSCFVPIIKDKPNSIKPLSIILEKFGDEESFSHPYEVEIEKFQPSDDQLTPVVAEFPLPMEKTPFVYVDTVKKLQELCKELNEEKEFAVDLEHHSYRTFQGITCLMQISSRKKDYLIDTIDLRNELQQLNESFTNPKICKVLHGADMDIQWLQRDFGVYIVNLFDTCQASRVLNFAHNSLAYLLKHYCKIEAKKEYQLADWRIRPLPQELIQYAREDTHYLLYIYDMLRNELINKGNNQQNLLQSVFQRSKLICLKKYEKPKFDENSFLSVYKKGKKSFNLQQLYAFKNLFAWRDKIARQEDESLGYVLPNHMMFQMAEILPREQQGLLACCHPVPPLVRQYLNEIHKIILEAREISEKQPDIVKSSTVIPHSDNPIDLDNILNCPHDIIQETDSHLPTLLNHTDESTFIPEIPTVNEEIHFSCPTKLSASIFMHPSKINFNSEACSSKFISPYQRYRLVRPIDSLHSNNHPSKTEVKSSDSSRIDNLYKHLQELKSQENVNEKFPSSNEEPTVIVDSLVNQTNNDDQNSCKEIDKQENKSDSDIEIITEIKKSRKRKRKRTKFQPDLFLKSNNEENTKTFRPYDYSQSESSSISSSLKEVFNPDKSKQSHRHISKPQKKKMKKHLSISTSKKTSSRNKCWPKK